MSDDLASRLQALEDKQAILDRLHRYAQLHDGPLDAYLDCYTADGALDHVGRDRAEGIDAIRARWERSRSGDIPPRKLVLLEPIVTLDGDRATVRAEYVYLVTGGGAPTIHSFGRYEDELVRCEDGEWRIREKLVHAQSA